MNCARDAYIGRKEFGEFLDVVDERRDSGGDVQPFGGRVQGSYGGRLQSGQVRDQSHAPRSRRAHQRTGAEFHLNLRALITEYSILITCSLRKM